VGGSWGSTLALAYSQMHSHRVEAMVLYSIFLGDASGISFTYGPHGACKHFPKEYEAFLSGLSPQERASPLETYARHIQSPEDSVRLRAKSRLAAWALTCLALTPDEDWIASVAAKPECMGDGALIEMHYMTNACFIKDGQLLRDCARIAHIPIQILHGRYDMMCLPSGAWELHKVLPRSTLQIIPESGHSSSAAPRLRSAIIDAINHFR